MRQNHTVLRMYALSAQQGRWTELHGWYLVSFIGEKHFIKKLDKGITIWVLVSHKLSTN